MLEAIATYADQMGLASEPGFIPKFVRWQLNFDLERKNVKVEALGVASGKRNPGLEITGCPEYPANEMQAGGKAHPLVESANVVCLLTPKPELEATEKDRRKREHFLGLLQDYASHDPRAVDLAEMLQLPEVQADLLAQLRELKAKPEEKVTLAIRGERLVEDNAVKEWWRAKRNTGTTRETETAGFVDFLTGELVEPLESHPKIKGLASVGGSAVGSSLISFDKDAFQSYGLAKSKNAALSDANASRYSAGLNHLLARGKKLEGLIVAHWYSRPLPIEDDILDYLDLEPSPGEDRAEILSGQERVRALYRAIQEGKRPDLAGVLYRILHVSGAAGRVMVRHWTEGAFEDLVANINRWLDDLALVSSNGVDFVRPPRTYSLALSTVRVREDLRTVVEQGLLFAAYEGQPIPKAVALAALQRDRIDALSGTTRPDRIALLKAYLIRSNSAYGKQMNPNVNLDHPSVAYQAGRLLRIYADLQQNALGDVNANIVQRFYPSAMATPHLAFGRLTKLAQFHLNKLDPGIARIFEKDIASVFGHLSPNNLPKTFTPEQQMEFACGYYQEHAHRQAQLRANTEAKRQRQAEETNPQGENE